MVISHKALQQIAGPDYKVEKMGGPYIGHSSKCGTSMKNKKDKDHMINERVRLKKKQCRFTP